MVMDIRIPSNHNAVAWVDNPVYSLAAWVDGTWVVVRIGEA